MSRLEITLKSDLCAASGDGFSSVIDTDVSYDKYGFPVIGGRRLKGCLRQAAERIGSDKIAQIFGESGKNSSGSLKISDAVIENYDILKPEAKALQQTKGEKISAEKIISLFTYTRASTAIEKDTAKENSLRFTRVIKRYSPFETQKELKFIAEIELDKAYKEEFSDICKALRNIGYKRNRGFGAVECHFYYEEKKTASLPEQVSDEEERQYSYTIQLKENVMIPGNVSDETMEYISGTSVLGFLANRYIAVYGRTPEFDEIFLKNHVKFSNLYISDESGTEYFPAPVILGKIKGEKGVFNIITYANQQDTIIKPVKTGFCDFHSHIIKPLTETVYHHSTGKNSTLYTQTSLCSDQYFRGTITGKANYIAVLQNLLETSSLRFGRSKTAQYSDCTLVHGENIAYRQEKVHIAKGEKFIALLLSDILIPDESAGYDISADALKKAIGLENLECDKDSEKKHSALRYRVITGYNTKWNIQKPHIRTIAAGSTLVFTAEEDMTLSSRIFAGAKQNEGFGQVLFCKADDFAETSQEESKSESAEITKGVLADLIAEKEKTEQMRKAAIAFVKNQSENINSSQIGRFLLMTKNANDLRELETWLTPPEDKHDAAKEYFLNLIKTSNAEAYGTQWRKYLTLILTLIKYAKRREEKTCQKN